MSLRPTCQRGSRRRLNPVFLACGRCHRGDELVGLGDRGFEIGDERIDIGADRQQFGVESADGLCIEVVLEEQHPIT